MSQLPARIAFKNWIYRIWPKEAETYFFFWPKGICETIKHMHHWFYSTVTIHSHLFIQKVPIEGII